MLFRQNVMATVASLAMWACGSGVSKEAVDKAEKSVLDVHDEVMPKIGDILKLNKLLRRRTDSLESVPATDAAVRVRVDEEKEQIAQLTRRLNEADSLMMGWMTNYKGDTLPQLKPDQALDYLKQEQTKIDDVKQKLNSGIQQAQAYLKK